MRLEDEVPYLPTPEEIEAAAAQIRETWSEAELYRRAGLTRAPVEIPVVHVECLEDFAR
jgi:hypothetical protein